MLPPMPRKAIKTKPKKARTGSSPGHRPAAHSLKSTFPLLKEELLAMAFRLSPHPIGITELETGRCLEINDACLEIFGFQRQEVIGRTTLMLGIWPDPEERSRLIERIKAERSVRDVEVTMRTNPGDRRRFLISANLVKLGKKRCLLTIGNDITERKQAEAALQESEGRFRTLVQNIPGAVYRCAADAHWTVAYISEAIEEIVGYPAKEFIGHLRTYASVIHPDDRRRVEETVWAGLQERRPYVIEYRVIHANGPVRWVYEKGQGVFAADGQVHFLDGAIFDITERKEAEEALQQLNATLEQRITERSIALRESKERFRAFLDNAPNLAFMKALDNRYLYVNRRFEQAFGLEQKRVVGKTDAELFLREQAAQFHTNDRRVLETESPMEFEEEAIYADGPHTSIVVKFPVRDGEGRVYATGGIVTDITDRKRAEEELRRAEAFTASVLDNLPNMVFVKDAKNLRFVHLNKAGERLLGYSEQELLGKNDYEFFPPTEADFFTSKDREVLAGGRLLDIPEEPINTRNGAIRLLHTKKIPITDQEGNPLYLLGISEDITERKQVEEELLRNQEALRQQQMQLQDLTSKLIMAQEQERQRIARDLHDDFSQRMAALVLDVVAIEQQPSLRAEQLSDLLRPVRERLEQLSDDIHDLAYKLHPSLLEHAGLRAAVEDHLRDLMNRTALRVSFKAHHVPEALSLDHSTGLFRVLQESLQNVVKHAKATEVSVKLSGSSRGVGLSVTDNGTGFDAQETSAHRQGLGLINMQERLRLLGGFLQIHAKPGDGTKVCAWIPLKERAS